MEKLDFRDWIDLFDLEPDIPINYREQLYVCGRNLLLKFNHLVELLIERNNLSYSKLAKLFNVSDKQLRNWRTGKTPVPLKILKIVSNQYGVDKKKIENEIDYISSSKQIKVNIPRTITPLLIEILGRFSGDGSCGVYQGDYKWSFKEEGKKFVNQNLRDMELIFGISGTYIDYGTYAENLIRSKPLVLLFQQIFDYENDFEKTYEITLPFFLYNIDWEYRKYFTTGLIDTEGSFYYSNQSYYFEIHMVNKNMIMEVANAFDAFGIPYKRKHRNFEEFKLISYGKLNCSLISDIFEIKNEKHIRKLINWRVY
jgi:transcriptional regulator with XRE-family HTH domain